MKPYWALLSARYRMLLQYRVAALAGATTQFWWGFILIMVLEAFYRSSSAAQPLSFEQAVTYIWLGQALLGMLPWNHDLELEAMIRRGDVAYELVRPVDLYNLWYARTLAMRAARTSLRVAPMVLITGPVLAGTPLEPWALRAPESLAAGGLFALAVGAALVLGVAITTLVHISLMWTISGDGVSRLVPAAVTLLSGAVIPLPLFPDWAQAILAALPFRGLADVPYRIYMGHILVSEAGPQIALTLIWAAVIVATGRVALRRGCRRLVVQGG